MSKPKDKYGIDLRILHELEKRAAEANQTASVITPQSPMYASDRLLVVLVHGTWGASSTWTKESSLLRNSLKKILPKKTEYHCFKWSGRNNHQARRRAGTELYELLLAFHKQVPERRIVLITHSHGGNVAMYALRYLGTVDYIAGMVAIATPFIRIRPRTITEGSKNLLKFCYFEILMVMLVLILGTANAIPIYFHLSEYAAVFSVLLGVVVMSFLFAFWEQTFDRGPRIFKALQRRLCLDLNTESSSSVSPILSITTARDEARNWLSLIRQLSNIPARAFYLLSKSAHVRVLLFPISVFILMMVYANYRGSVSNSILDHSGMVTLYLLGGLFYAWVSAPLIQVFMAILPMALRSHILGYGGESFLHNWLLDISVSEKPPGKYGELRRYNADDLDSIGSNGSFLLHTKIYNSQKVCTDIANWIHNVIGQ